MDGRKGQGITDVANQTGSRTRLEHTYIRLTRQKVSTPSRNTTNVVKTTEKGSFDSPTGIPGDENDSWRETGEADGRENYELVHHVD